MRDGLIGDMEQRLQCVVTDAMKQGASAVSAGFHRGERVSCSFESGRLKTVGGRENQGYHIDVLLDRRRGSVSGNDIDAMDDMLARALALARLGSDVHFQAWPAPAPCVHVKCYSEATLGLSRERLIESGQLIVDGLKAYNAGMDINARASRHEGEGLLVTSGGVCHVGRDTGWSLGGGAQRTEGTDMLFASHGHGWCELNEFYDPDHILKHILQYLEWGETVVESPVGNCPCYIPHGVVPMFVSPLGMGINGRNVAKGDSPLRDRLGEQVLDSCLTIVDDPHRDFCPGACEIDSDGIPTRKQVLFDKGVLKRYLYDLDTAGMAGTEPTGNRGCSPYTMMITPGVCSSAELISRIDDGIYIVELIGFGQSNIMNGDFSANVGLGFRVQNGEVVGRVKNTMIAGNIYELLKSGVQVSADVDPVTQRPAMVLQGVAVSAA